jgi:multiple sugar transport system ATP-binding protein
MQRVAIGRALVREPQVYLMDEPLSSLDAKLRADLRVELKRIQMELGATVLYVTHDQIEAMTMATRIGVLNQGELLQLGPPREVYEQPNSIYVAQRLGMPQINLLPADALPVLRAPRSATTIGVRTEHLLISEPQGADFPARVHRVEHLGDQTHVHLEFQGRSLITLADPSQSFAHNEQVGLRLVEPLFFDKEGARVAASA